MTYVPFAYVPFVILLAGLGWLAVDVLGRRADRRALVRQRIERRLAESGRRS